MCKMKVMMVLYYAILIIILGDAVACTNFHTFNDCDTMVLLVIFSCISIMEFNSIH